jgi:hypothetical protein
VNSQTAVEKALRLITPSPSEAEKVQWRTRLNVLVDEARTEMADEIHSSGDRELRALLRKTFPVITTNADGIASLNPLLTATEPLLLKHLNTAEILVAGNNRRLTLLPDESAVRMDRTPGFPFGTVIGTDLLAWEGGAPFTGEVTIRGPFVPLLANIQGQLDQRYVLTLFQLGSNQIPSRTRTQVQELKSVAAEGK